MGVTGKVQLRLCALVKNRTLGRVPWRLTQQTALPFLQFAECPVLPTLDLWDQSAVCLIF